VFTLYIVASPCLLLQWQPALCYVTNSAGTSSNALNTSAIPPHSDVKQGLTVAEWSSGSLWHFLELWSDLLNKYEDCSCWAAGREKTVDCQLEAKLLRTVLCTRVPTERQEWAVTDRHQETGRTVSRRSRDRLYPDDQDFDLWSDTRLAWSRK
jgi:hypothetical protein